MKSRLETKTIREILALNKKPGRVTLRPAYQRESVWTFKQQVYLIDSILQGLPLPKLFLDGTSKQTADGTQEHYDVVDGQQRLMAIFEFEAGTSKAGKKEKPFILAAKNSASPKTFGRFEGRPFEGTYEGMSEALKKKFLNYELHFQVITDASKKEIKEMFHRLNQGGVKLNKQENRRAIYVDSNFYQLVSDTTKDYREFLLKNKILPKPHIKRQLDAEYLSLLYEVMQKSEAAEFPNKTKTLTEFYDENQSTPEEALKKWRKNFDATMELINKIFSDPQFPLAETKFNSRNNFYSLFYMCYHFRFNENLKITDYKELRDQLKIFDKELRSYKTSEDNFIKTYGDSLIKDGGDIKEHRQTRHDYLVAMMEGYVINRALKKHFTEQEKDFLWFSSPTKLCGICGKEIEGYAHCEIDHRNPWAKGGRTVLSNAQLTHAQCSREKRDEAE